MAQENEMKINDYEWDDDARDYWYEIESGLTETDNVGHIYCKDFLKHVRVNQF